MRNKIAPLPATTLLLGMFGFLIAVFFIRNISINFAWVVGIFSAILFFASMISTSYGPVEEELALDALPEERKKRVQILTKQEWEAKQAKKHATTSATKPINERTTQKSFTKTASSKKPTIKRTIKKAPKRQIKS